MPPPAVPVVGRPARLAAAAAAVGMPAVAALAEAPAAVWEGRVRRPAAWEDRLPLRAGVAALEVLSRKGRVARPVRVAPQGRQI